MQINEIVRVFINKVNIAGTAGAAAAAVVVVMLHCRTWETLPNVHARKLIILI